MNRWKSIWENKTEVHSQNILNSLIKSDGFDSVYAQYTNQEWESICNKIVAHSKFDINSKTIEIGCGSGAIIYCISMFNGGGGGRGGFYGIDYSRSLIEIAKKTMPEFVWSVEESYNLSYPDDFFDNVLIHSVLQYMPNHNYLEKTLEEARRVCKNGGTIIIADIYDEKKFDDYLTLRSRAKGLSVSEYLKENSGYEHMFLSFEYVRNFFKNSVSVQKIDLNCDQSSHINSQYNFSVKVIK
jgi:ubiquinone/menaquinone biosynthesis C-methylase UbiE